MIMNCFIFGFFFFIKKTLTTKNEFSKENQDQSEQNQTTISSPVYQINSSNASESEYSSSIQNDPDSRRYSTESSNLQGATSSSHYHHWSEAYTRDMDTEYEHYKVPRSFEIFEKQIYEEKPQLGHFIDADGNIQQVSYTKTPNSTQIPVELFSTMTPVIHSRQHESVRSPFSQNYSTQKVVDYLESNHDVPKFIRLSSGDLISIQIIPKDLNERYSRIHQSQANRKQLSFQEHLKMSQKRNSQTSTISNSSQNQDFDSDNPYDGKTGSNRKKKITWDEQIQRQESLNDDEFSTDDEITDSQWLSYMKYYSKASKRHSHGYQSGSQSLNFRIKPKKQSIDTIFATNDQTSRRDMSNQKMKSILNNRSSLDDEGMFPQSNSYRTESWDVGQRSDYTRKKIKFPPLPERPKMDFSFDDRRSPTPYELKNLEQEHIYCEISDDVNNDEKFDRFQENFNCDLVTHFKRMPFDNTNSNSGRPVSDPFGHHLKSNMRISQSYTTPTSPLPEHPEQKNESLNPQIPKDSEVRKRTLSKTFSLKRNESQKKESKKNSEKTQTLKSGESKKNKKDQKKTKKIGKKKSFLTRFLNLDKILSTKDVGLRRTTSLDDIVMNHGSGNPSGYETIGYKIVNGCDTDPYNMFSSELNEKLAVHRKKQDETSAE